MTEEVTASTDRGEVTLHHKETWATGDVHEVARVRQNVCMADPSARV